MGEIGKLFNIDKKWNDVFKASLIEGILEKYFNIEEFINLVKDEWIPIWISENTELEEYYILLLNELENLDLEKLKYEYKLYFDLYSRNFK